MNSVFLAWQNPGATREWYPIGRLDADTATGPYRYRYTHGAERAHQEVGLEPLMSFPDFNRLYESQDLFPLFKNRLLSAEREDFEDYLQYLNLRPDQADPLVMLAITEGRRQTDTLEVFPKIARNEDGGFHCRFFLHGWRHVAAPAQDRILGLVPNEQLRVAIEMSNPATGVAVQLQTNEYQMIGWTPRYLVQDLVSAISESFTDICAKVVRVNPDPAPSPQRVLIEMSGRWPDNREPMSSRDFQDIPFDVRSN